MLTTKGLGLRDESLASSAYWCGVVAGCIMLGCLCLAAFFWKHSEDTFGAWALAFALATVVVAGFWWWLTRDSRSSTSGPPDPGEAAVEDSPRQIVENARKASERTLAENVERKEEPVYLEDIGEEPEWAEPAPGWGGVGSSGPDDIDDGKDPKRPRS
jgi:hypothetical protein